MRLLLDTHSFVWFVEDNPRLSPNARAHIEDGSNDVFVSVASLWEIAIKFSLGKLSLSQPFEVFIPQQLSANSFTLVGITFEHTALVARLPYHHRDPFDRLLVAQARVEQMQIVSADSALDAYDITRLW